MSSPQEMLLTSLKEEHEQLHVLRLQLETARQDCLADLDSDARWHAAQAALREFANHLDRHFSFEEQDGFLLMVLRRKPKLARTVEDLRTEHDVLREHCVELSAQCEMHLSREERRDRIGPRLQALLDQLHEHEKKEHQIVQEAFYGEFGRV